MSKVSDRVAEIETQIVGQTGKRVLLVEGKDDVDGYRVFLNKRMPTWEQTWAIAEMGNKSQVLKALPLMPNWLGLVDRDEWSHTTRQAQLAQHPNLRVLPRFCLESYLVSPTELWQAFPQKQRDKISDGLPAFKNLLSADKDQWVRHAALWHEVRPLWQQLRDAGFPDEVTKPSGFQTDQALLNRFGQWSAVLGNPDSLLQRIHDLETQLHALPEEDFFKEWLYAKAFYPQVVNGALDALLGQKSPKERRKALFEHRPVPDDLDDVWRAMGLIT